MRSRFCTLLASISLFACHGTERETTPDPIAEPQPTQPASRQLDAETTFAELVGRARSIEASGDAESTARCVLSRRDGSLTLEASIAAAIHPLPDAQERLEERLMQGSRVTVLSRWGRIGDGPFALVTITPSVPLADDTAVLVLTPRGIYLRTTGADLAERARGAWALGRLGEGLTSLGLHAGDTVVVTANGSMSVATVADVLEAITPLGVHAVLAVALPPDTPIPTEPTLPARPEAVLCEALPPVAADTASGDLRVEDVRRGAAALADIAIACARSTSSIAVARGGRVDLLMRVGPEGGVVDACARADDIDDDAYRHCLVGAARGLTFTPPIPPGYVDIAVPVRLRADTSDALTPLCAN
jgi:hypothetical protein